MHTKKIYDYIADRPLAAVYHCVLGETVMGNKDIAGECLFK